ncbi:MAG TPA: GIY-YIG nuclease family protein [Candidatus Acidoferrales bacterium]|nr:GIY-YIG nuclease family protein [Candidatus Acidoferrales bacterium]
MSFYVYVLSSLTAKRFYVGQTKDLTDRLRRHNRGRVKSTKAFRPWSVVYFEKYETRGKAMRRERELKGLKGTARFLEVAGAAKW